MLLKEDKISVEEISVEDISEEEITEEEITEEEKSGRKVTIQRQGKVILREVPVSPIVAPSSVVSQPSQRSFGTRQHPVDCSTWRVRI